MCIRDRYSVGKDTFINEMIQTIGAENIFANQDAWISPSEESVIDANPDVILTNVNYVENPTKEIMSRDGWDNICLLYTSHHKYN